MTKRNVGQKSQQDICQRTWQGMAALTIGLVVMTSSTLAAPEKPHAGKKAVSPARRVPGPAARQYHQDREVLALRQTLQMVRHLSAQKKTAEIEKIKKQITERYLAPGKPTPSPEQLRMLAQIYRAAGDATQAQGLTEAWLKAFQTNEEYRAGMTPSSLLDLAKESKNIGQDAVMATVAQAGEQWLAAKMGKEQPPSFTDLCDLLELGILVDSKNLQQAARQAMAGKDKTILRKELAPFELVRYSQVLATTSDKQAQKQLMTFIVKEYLTEKRQDSMKVQEWMALANLVAASEDRPLRAGMLDAVEDRLREGKLDITQYAPMAVKTLAVTLKTLGGGPEVDTLVAQGSLGSQDWDQVDAPTRQLLTGAAQGDEKAVTGLSTSLAQKHEAGKLHPAEYRAIGSVLCKTTSQHGQRLTWMERCLKRSTTSPQAAAQELVLLAELFSAPYEKVNAEQAQTLVKALVLAGPVSTEIPDATYIQLGKVLRKYGKVLRKNLSNEQNHANLGVVKVLAWELQPRGKNGYFLKQLSRRMDDSSGDVRASWELALGYVASMYRRENRSCVGSSSYIQRALAACQTDDMRLRCLEELASTGQAAGEIKLPLQVIQSVENQFQGPQKQRVTELKKQLEKAGATTKQS